ncbi:MAG: hypothetical protein JEZ06_00105 [Anaerolineaceae bacterium]|nr:hypothetical protein [Anaerolineaceae bacterium]
MEIIALFIAVIVSGICLTALFLALSSLFPHYTNKIQKNTKKMKGRSFILGLINTIFFLAIILGIIALADSIGLQFIYLFAFILIGIFIIGLILGLTALVQFMGEKISPEGSPNKQIISGALVLILACLTPFIGWFGFFPFLGMTGVGAVVITLFQRKEKSVKEIE